MGVKKMDLSKKKGSGAEITNYPRLKSSQILILLGQRNVLGLFELAFDLFLPVGVHVHLWGLEGRHGNELKVGITDQLSGQPEERFFEVVVGLGRDVVVLRKWKYFKYISNHTKLYKRYLEILFPVENDRLGLDFPVFDVNFVSTEDNWDVFTDPHQISMPVGNILVSDSGSDIKHNDGTLALYPERMIKH